MPDPTTQKLAIEVAELRERMKTQHAIYENGIQALRADIADYKADQAKRDADYRETAAKRETKYLEEVAKRETNHQAAINTLSEKMVNREIRLIIALIMIIGLAFTIFRVTLPTSTTHQVEAIAASKNPAT